MDDAPVLLTSDRVTEASQVLAAAFADDPMTLFFFPDASRRRGYAWVHAATLRMGLSLGATYTTPGPRVEGVVAFHPPGRYPLPLWLQVWHFRAAPLRLSPLTLLRGMRVSAILGRVHPREPHWYLAILAVHPDRQRQGIGSFLITPTLERADRDRLPVYLETTKEANLAYYRRFGFEVLQELTVPGGGPQVWTMLRPPRA